ncbi:MAG: hypothetical protein IH988_05930 [Planctomycetes bacterium]|nr:hypothetical protein [Planctomycetota bacterium]
MRTRIYLLNVLAIAFAVLGWNQAVRADVPGFIVERVARTGDPVPGIEGATFTWLDDQPLIDGEGNVLILAAFNDGTKDRGGYFYGQPGELELIVEGLDQAPGFDEGVLYQNFPYANLAPNGTLTIKPDVGSGDDLGDWFRAMFTGPPDGLTLTMYVDGPAPGLPEGATTFGIHDPNINAAGQIATFGGILVPDHPNGSYQAITAGPPDDLQIVAHGFGEAPDIEGGATFINGQVPSVGGITYNDLGWVGFSAFFEGPLVDEYNFYGLFVGSADDLRLVARQGSQAPGMDPGVEFFNFLTVVPQLNGLGDVVFRGVVEGSEIDETNNIGVWAGPREAPDLVPNMRTGCPAPGTPSGVVFSGFLGAMLNGRSELLIWGALAGDGIDSSNNHGYWFGPPDDVRLLVWEGQQAFGLPEGVVVTFDGDSNYLRSPRFEMNGRGDLLMAVPLIGLGVDETNDAVLYYRSGGVSDWTFVLRTGAVLDGLPVAPHGISSDSFNYTTGSNGAPRGMNEDGEFVIFLEFPDDVTGIYRFSPLPTRLLPGDFDRDHDVDLIDFGAFQRCFEHDSEDCLSAFDFDDSGAIDLLDFEAFQEALTGP